MGIHRDAWGLQRADTSFSVGTKKMKNFVWGMCGDIHTHYFLHGELPTQIFLRGDLCGEDLCGSVIQGCTVKNFQNYGLDFTLIS